MSYVFDSVTKW